MKGFSRSNLMYIKKWYLFYSENSTIVQQPVGQFAKQLVSKLPVRKISQQAVGQIGQRVITQITQIPWGHNIAIISKCKNIKEALCYVQNTVTHNWSRSVLVHQIESGLYKREGKSVTNFALTLPKPQSDLAEQTLKDPYIFNFLSMTKKYDERDLESEYKLTHSLPKKLKSSLPTIEQIEKELSKDIIKAKK